MKDPPDSLDNERTQAGDLKRHPDDNQSLGDRPTHIGDGPQGSKKRRAAAPQPPNDESIYRLIGSETASDAVGVDGAFDQPSEFDLQDRYLFQNRRHETEFIRVISATDRSLNRQVLIRLLVDDSSVSLATRRSFISGIKTFARVNSHAVARVFDYGLANQGAYVVLESVDGRTVLDHLQTAVLGQDRCINIAIQVCEAISLFHSTSHAVPLLDADHVWLTHAGTVKLTGILQPEPNSAEPVDLDHALHLGLDLFLPRSDTSRATESACMNNLAALARLIYQMSTGTAWSETPSTAAPKPLAAVIRRGLQAGQPGGFRNVEEFRTALHRLAPDSEAVRAVESDDMACLQPECGHVNPASSAFCVRCGEPLSRVDQSPVRSHWMGHAISSVAARFLVKSKESEPVRVEVPAWEVLARIVLAGFLAHVFDLNCLATTVAILAAFPIVLGRVTRLSTLKVGICVLAGFLLDYIWQAGGLQFSPRFVVIRGAIVSQDAVCLLTLLLAFYAYRASGRVGTGLLRLWRDLQGVRWGRPTQSGTAVVRIALVLAALLTLLSLLSVATPATLGLRAGFFRLVVWGATGLVLGRMLQRQAGKMVGADWTAGVMAGLLAYTMILSVMAGAWDSGSVQWDDLAGIQLAADGVHLLVFLLAALTMSESTTSASSPMRDESKWCVGFLALCVAIVAVPLIRGEAPPPAVAMGVALIRGGMLLLLVAGIKVLGLINRPKEINWPGIVTISLALLVLSLAVEPVFTEFLRSWSELPGRGDTNDRTRW
jgi:hypothetical protein